MLQRYRGLCEPVLTPLPRAESHHAAAGAASVAAAPAAVSLLGLCGWMLTPMLLAVPMTLLQSDSSVRSGESFCLTCVITSAHSCDYCHAGSREHAMLDGTLTGITTTARHSNQVSGYARNA